MNQELPLLLIETSGRVGHVGLAFGERLVAERHLNEARRHARDLAPTVAELLHAHALTPRDVHAVVVGRGPGSYTGLRVGIMSAKSFAYATGCRILAIDTFLALALQQSLAAPFIDIIADAQQDQVYWQRFERVPMDSGTGLRFLQPLQILPFAHWLDTLTPEVQVAGPGLVGQVNRLQSTCMIAPESDWHPRVDSLLLAAKPRLTAGESDDFFSVEPHYARPSSAEQKWDQHRAQQ